MRLIEVSYVLGDDGGMMRQMDDAMKNMEHHSKTNKDKNIRDLCKQAISGIRGHMQRPLSLYDDPYTFLKILQCFKGEPNINKIKHAVDTLGTYTQTDND